MKVEATVSNLEGRSWNMKSYKRNCWLAKQANKFDREYSQDESMHEPVIEE